MIIAPVRIKFHWAWLHLKSLWKLFMFLAQIKKKFFEEWKNILILQFLLSTVFSSKLQTQSKLRQSWLHNL